MLDMVVSAVAKLREDEGGAKRAKKEEVDSNSKEEPIVPVEFKNVNGEDDGHNNICWDIRTKLPTYVGPQEAFWAQQPQVVHPLRAEYDTDFLRLDPVNSQVTIKDHDRGATRTIKQYLKQNIRVENKKLVLSNSAEDASDYGVRRDYVESTGVYQVVSGLWQYQSNLWMVRRDDHSGVLLLRLLHDVKFFLPNLLTKFGNKATRDKKQLEVVRWFVDECLRRNSLRGRQGRPPLNYQEARRVAQSALHNIYSGSGVELLGDIDLDVISFDPYTAAGGSDVQVGPPRFKNLNRKRNGRGAPGSGGRGGTSRAGGAAGGGTAGGGTAGGGGSGGSGGAGGSGGSDGSGNGSLPCRAWNGGACTWSPCKFKHFCNVLLPSGDFCKKNHMAKDH